MTITYDWRIANLEHEIEDGYVFIAHWTVTATDSEVNPDDHKGGRYSARAYGSVGLERPDSLIPYDSLTEETVVAWVKDKFSVVPESDDPTESDDPDIEPPKSQLQRIEEALAARIAEQKNPYKESGLPW